MSLFSIVDAFEKVYLLYKEIEYTELKKHELVFYGHFSNMKDPDSLPSINENHWLEAVLCKVDEFPKEEKKPLSCSGNASVETMKNGVLRMNAFFERLLGKPTDTELSDEEVDKVRTWIDSLSVERNTKMRLISVLEAQEKQELPEKGELLYRIVNGNDFLKYAGTVSDREVGMRVIDQRIMEMLGVSMNLAEEIRKQVFIFAADRIDRMPQHNELLYYGGVK